MWISSVNTQISQCSNIPRARMPPTMSKTTWWSLSRRPVVFVHRSLCANKQTKKKKSSKQNAEKHKSRACHLDSCSSVLLVRWPAMCWSQRREVLIQPKRTDHNTVFRVLSLEPGQAPKRLPGVWYLYSSPQGKRHKESCCNRNQLQRNFGPRFSSCNNLLLAQQTWRHRFHSWMGLCCTYP